MDERIVAPIVADDDEKRTICHPLAVTRAEHTTSMLVLLLYTLFKMTGEREYLGAMTDILEKAEPDFKHAPSLDTPGLVAFYDFHRPLSDEHAVQVAQELKVSTCLLSCCSFKFLF
jgi:hypothetical protein